MLLSVAVLVKPALKVAWPPEPDPAMSDDTGPVADGSDQPDFSVAEDQSSFETAPGSTVAQSDRPTNAASEPATPADRTGQPRLAESDPAKDQPAAAQTASSPAPADAPVSPQSEMADITRSIVRDYAARRERALLSPTVAATSLPLEADEARQSQQRSVDDARRASDVVVAEAEDKLVAEQKRTSALADQLADAKTQLAAAESTVGHLRDSVTSTESKSADWHRAAEQARAEADDSKTALAQVTAEVSDAKEALAKARTEATNATTALAQARAEASDAADRQRNRDQAAASRVEELQQQLDVQSARAVDLARELESVRAQLADADRQKTADADERRALEAASKDLDAKLQDEQKKSAALAAELATAQASIRQLQERAKALQAAAAPVRPGQATRGKKQERTGPEVRLLPAGPASPLVRLSPSAPADEPRSRAAKLIEGKAGAEDRAAQTSAAGPKGQRTVASRGVGRSGHGRSGEVIAYIPESPVQDEGYTSDDYSPYDTSDHTVYIDEYVSTPKGRSTPRRAEVRVAKRSVDLR